MPMQGVPTWRPWINASIYCLVSFLKWLVIDFEIANIHLNTSSHLSNAQGIKCHTIAHILQLSGVEQRKTEIRNCSIFKIENCTMLKPFWRFQGSFVFWRYTVISLLILDFYGGSLVKTKDCVRFVLRKQVLSLYWMFQSILRPLSCSVNKQFLLRLDPKFLSSLGTHRFHLKSFYFHRCI